MRSQTSERTCFGSMGVYDVWLELIDDVPQGFECLTVAHPMQAAAHFFQGTVVHPQVVQNKAARGLVRLMGAAHKQGFVFLRKEAREVGGVVGRPAQIEAVDDAKDARHAPKEGQKKSAPGFPKADQLNQIIT